MGIFIKTTNLIRKLHKMGTQEGVEPPSPAATLETAPVTRSIATSAYAQSAESAITTVLASALYCSYLLHTFILWKFTQKIKNCADVRDNFFGTFSYRSSVCDPDFLFHRQGDFIHSRWVPIFNFRLNLDSLSAGIFISSLFQFWIQSSDYATQKAISKDTLEKNKAGRKFKAKRETKENQNNQQEKSFRAGSIFNLRRLRLFEENFVFNFCPHLDCLSVRIFISPFFRF